MFEDFREYSVAEFFKKNRHMLGFSGKIKSLTTVVHELVTNSLDACEEAEILPDIKVEIYFIDNEKAKVIVSDNGPGIPKELIGKVYGKLLAGTKFHKYKQQRGQQGIGAAGVTMYSKITTGVPVHVISMHRGKMVIADVSIDINRNEPIVENMVETDTDVHGVIVEVVVGDVKIDKGEYSVYEYIRQTAIANPHASIELIVNGERIYYPRQIDVPPKRPVETLPHILGITPYEFYEMARNSTSRTLRSFILNSFDRVTNNKLDELGNVLKSLDISLEKSPKEVTWEEVEKIIKVVKTIKWYPPRKDVLIPIGEANLQRTIEAVYRPELIVTRTRDPKIYRDGIPFIVEVGIAYGGNVINRIHRYANRVPLLFDSSACAIPKAIQEIDWNRYEIQDINNSPIAIVVHLASVFIPYVSAGKTAIAQEEEIVQEIKLALMDAARAIKDHIKEKYKIQEMNRKKQALLRYVDQLSSDISSLSGEDREFIKNKLEEIIREKYSI
ncbi:MAG: DNA topoisomerase VI subunit B [Candidatus Micrarchaeota archaeon]|nr:DNA topoisomerase VI subunit B [Candidatus Micrarchaeota archaeon]